MQVIVTAGPEEFEDKFNKNKSLSVGAKLVKCVSVLLGFKIKILLII